MPSIINEAAQESMLATAALLKENGIFLEEARAPTPGEHYVIRKTKKCGTRGIWMACYWWGSRDCSIWEEKRTIDLFLYRGNLVDQSIVTSPEEVLAFYQQNQQHHA